jgi:rhamnosyltransferase
LKKFDNHKNSITIIKSKNFEPSSASKNFFKILDVVNCNEYDYISFCDQDDIWFPEKITESIKKMQEFNADAYSSNLSAFNNDSRKSWTLEKSNNQKKFDYLFQGASAGCTYVLSSRAAQLVKTIMGNDLRNFPRHFSHDWTIYAICRSHGLKWVHDNRAFIAYRQHTKNVFGAKPGLIGLIQKIRMASDGWYRSHVLFLKKFLACSKDEIQIISAVENMSITSKIYLLKNIFSFRRKTFDSIYLGIVFVFGLF